MNPPLPPVPFVYDLIATHKDGAQSKGQLSAKQPLSIGCAMTAGFQLSGEKILPLQADLLLTDTNDALIVNLGTADSLLLNGAPLRTFVPNKVKPGDTLRLADYELRLVSSSAGSDLDGKTMPPSYSASNGGLESGSKKGRSAAKMSMTAAGQDDLLDTTSPVSSIPLGNGGLPKPTTPIDAAPRPIARLSTSSPTAPPSLPPMLPPALPVKNDVPVRIQRAEKPQDRPPILYQETERYFPPPDQPTELFSGSLPDAGPNDLQSGNTLPKAWSQMGRLGAQLTIDPVNLAPGERIRIPLSIRNEFSHTVELRLTQAGLPRHWITLPTATLKLAPGEVRAVDLILQPPSTVSEKAIRAVLALSDVLIPNVALTVPLHLIFKRAPDLVGWLDPLIVREPDPAYLYLQNHAQGAAQVFIAGHSAAKGLHVITDETWITLPPGQLIKIPIRLDARKRPLFGAVRHAFGVSATQGNRAPLDYMGTVQIGPRVTPSRLFALSIGLFCLTLIGLALIPVLLTVVRLLMR